MAPVEALVVVDMQQGFLTGEAAVSSAPSPACCSGPVAPAPW
ncbi:hypothetical protein ACJ6WF_32865 [Streptomyces sp. MMS24-I2-30]